MIAQRYDIVGVVTNDLVTDQRMQRIFKYYASKGLKSLLIGHQNVNSAQLSNQPYDEKRINTSFSSGPLFYLEYNLKILWLLLFIKTRKLYAVDLDTLLGVGTAAKLKRKPYLFDAHELFTEVPELEGAQLKKRIWKIIGQLFIKGADKRITVGYALKELLEEKYNRKFEVIPNYPELKEPSQNPKPKEKIILYQGKVNKGRGIKEMIGAMDFIHNEVELWIVGHGDIYDKMIHFASHSQAKDRIKFLGEVRPSQLHDFTQNAWLGINLLDHSSLNYYVSAANKVYDYIMAEVPYLTMDFPEYRMINTKHECGILIDKLEPNLIADKVNGLLMQTELYNKMLGMTSIAKGEMNWSRVSQRLDSFF